MLRRFVRPLLASEKNDRLIHFDNFSATVIDDLLLIAQKKEPENFLIEAATVLIAAADAIHAMGHGHIIYKSSLAVRAIVISSIWKKSKCGDKDDLKDTYQHLTDTILKELLTPGKSDTKYDVLMKLIQPRFGY